MAELVQHKSQSLATTGTRGLSLAENVILVVSASLFLAISAHASIALPFTPVPVTLQTFALLVIAFLLGPERAVAASMLYLLEGAFGAPVFAPGGLGGVAQLLGPTGGFLFAYPAVAYVAGLLFKWRSNFGFALVAAVAAEVLLFAAGASWFKLLTGVGFGAAMAATVFPFIAGEVLKIAAASAVAVRAKKALNL
jgi:biotin transport system substrate-specific component